VSDGTWNWIGEDTVLAIHDVQLAEHGGLSGLRDPALMQSALARPRNLAAYGEPDAARLAAAYAYGLVRNHAFADGNKRTAFVEALVFLLDNGFSFIGEDAESVTAMLALASGDMEEEEFAAWLRARIQPAAA
jgi:death on curing protein